MSGALRTTVTAGDLVIGPGHPPLFLPDIGTFFNQDLDQGLALIDDIAAAGLTFLKGEVLHDVDICLDTNLEETITSYDLKVTTERYRAVIERKVLPLPVYATLFARARAHGLKLAMSIYDETGLAFACDEDVEIIKIASSNIVHRPLIEATARTGRVTLIDTGKATFSEIFRAVGWFTRAGGDRLLLEHSPDPPPAPVSAHHLGMLSQFAAVFTCPIGLSDHHAGDEMLIAAVALGASVLEKGVCPDHVVCEQDRGHALSISNLAATVARCNTVYSALDGTLRDLSPPRPTHPARMGLVTARSIRAGERLDPSAVRYAFPATGIGVEHVQSALGRPTVRAMEPGEPIEWDDLVSEIR